MKEKCLHVHFVGGKRICIGWKYSMMFMKIFLIHFFKAYTVETRLKYEDLTIDMTPLMLLSQGYMISIKERKD
jgi:cytochrome P450